MREPERPDLSPLDPRQDGARWERMVATTVSRSMFELRRRRLAAQQQISIFDGLLAWTRPALATAAALVLISLFALTQVRSQPAQALTAAYFRSPNMPAPMTIMFEEGETPSLLDLLVLTSEN